MMFNVECVGSQWPYHAVPCCSGCPVLLIPVLDCSCNCQFQALFLVKGLIGTQQGWTFDMPHYKAHLSQWLFLLSCGPVALSFALDIAKLRRKENLWQPLKPLPDRHGDSLQMRQSWKRGHHGTEQRHGQKCPSHDEGYCASEVFGQLISPSALDDLARADFLLFDKGAVVDGSTLQLRGVCAGGACFSKPLARDIEHEGDLRAACHHCDSMESGEVPGESSSDCPCQKARTVQGIAPGNQDAIGGKTQPSVDDLEGAIFVQCGRCGIEMEDISAIEHYYTTHRDERGRLEVLAQVSWSAQSACLREAGSLLQKSWNS